MRFDTAIDAYLDDMQAEGRISSPHTVTSYRSRLNVLGEEVHNRSPHTVGIDDIERTLRRWPHPATGQHARSVYVSFCDWCQHKRLMKTNPARGTRPRRVKAPNVYRLSRSEVVALFAACEDRRETRAIHIGCLAGLRNAELCGLQLRHFKRPGAIWVSSGIAKGGRQRWIPVLAELEEVVADIHATVGEDDYVIAARRPIGGNDSRWREVPTLQSSPHALRTLVKNVGLRAGIAAHIHPHLLRHAFGDHVARQAGLRAAQATLGHASSATTSGTYTGAPTLDELTAALAFFRYDEAARTEASR
jgi:integrase/recombinase XerC